MKRRVISFITVLAMCLGLCPTWALAADREPDASLCPHHWVHTEECGYVPPVSGQDCTHEHDESCFITKTLCVHQHTKDCYPELEPSLCTHECSGDSGCVTLTLDCPHIHDAFCGYVSEDAGAPCMFVCRVCPIVDLIDKLPPNVTPENKSQVEDQLITILALYTELTGDEQEQLDLSRCFDLQAQLDAASTPMLLDDGDRDFDEDQLLELTEDKKDVGMFKVAGMSLLVDTYEYSWTETKTSVFQVQSTGSLHIVGSGTITSKNGSGVEVLAGGKLYLDDARLTITGSAYGLDIASGTEVKLSGGTFTGSKAAIREEDGDFGRLLKDGYAYFDASGNPITDMTTAKTVVVKASPTVAWPPATHTPATHTVPYTGDPVDIASLPSVTITAPEGDPESLRQYLVYSYRKVGDTDFKDYKADPPRNAGTYEVKAVLPAMGSYKAAETNPCLTLTISKKQMDITPPEAVTPTLTYNRASQELVTAGSICEEAILDGAVIEFATAQNGPFSETIPMGTDAKDYVVWYRVVNTENYTGKPATKVDGVKIIPKQIEPTIDVTEPSYVYDGSAKNPKITVRDGQAVIDDDQYTIKWKNKDNKDVTELRAADTYTATIENVTSGNNYIFSATATVEIVADGQNALSITGMPDHVYYGDVITTLDTTGGSENGTVTWSITPEDPNVTIDTASGGLTVKSMGTFTVKAERAVPNYKTVEDSWTFTVEPKLVTAEATVTEKVYDTNTNATVTARVRPIDLVNRADVITIDGLRGTYDDANVGTDKTVTLDTSNASTGGADADKYTVSYPATARGNITVKPVAVTVTLSGNDLQTEGSTYYYNYDGKDKTPAVTVTYTESGTAFTVPAGSYTVSYSNNKNVGTAAVTVAADPDGNYTFTNGPVTVNFAIRNAQAVLTSTPQAKDLTYNRAAQELVTVGTATGGTVVYSLTESGTYEAKIPSGTAAGTYQVFYKVKGDANHADTAPSQVSVTIKPKEVISPVITLDSYTVTYDGSAKTPGVTKVEDGGITIPDSEYGVTYRDNVNAGPATVIVSNKNGGNYIVNGTAAFTIEKAAPEVNAPTGNKNLPYNATAQELITRGSSSDGTMVYSLDGANYSEAVPTGTAVKEYTISYKVLGDSNHNDSTVGTVDASIIKNTVSNPTITLSSNTFRYNGSQQIPTITVRDDEGFLIAESEYEVTYTGTKSAGAVAPVEVDTYTVKVTEKAASNYSIQQNNTRTFEIVKADQEVLSITNMRDQVYYGDIIQLGTSGGTGNGTVTWEITGNTNTTITTGGLLTVRDVGGPITVTAKRSAGANYGEISAVWEFSPNKKPVTAVVTAADKVYDGNKTATLTAEIKSSDLVSGDTAGLSATGQFADADVGANKTVIINSVTIPAAVSAKYHITYPATTTASITPKAAAVPGVKGITGLTYNGSPQALVTAPSTVTDGSVAYSLDGVNYSLNIPTGTNADTYTVRYKTQGDRNHTDSEVKSVSVTIQRQTVTPTVELTPSEAPYDGSVQRPAVTVKDGASRVIPESEYTVTYGAGNWKDEGTYTVTIANASGGNYIITAQNAPFTITASESSPLEIVNKPGQVYFGDAPFSLSVSGGSGNGDITWESSNEGVATIAPNGLVTINGAGTVTITATKAATPNYTESTATYTFTVLQKPVTAAVTVLTASYTYDGTEKRPGVSVTIDGGTVLPSTDYAAKYSNNTDAGSATVTVESAPGGNYEFTPVSASFVIETGRAEFITEPQGSETELVYDGTSHPLVTPGAATLGKVEYSLDGTEFSEDIPTGTNADKYNVWYRVEGTDNYAGISAGPITVTIEKAEPSFVPPKARENLKATGEEQELIEPGSSSDGTFVYSLDLDGGYSEAIPKGTDADTYTVYYKFIGDANHKDSEVETITVDIREATPSDSGTGDEDNTYPDIPAPPPSSNPEASAPSTPGTPSAQDAPMQTIVQNHTATTILNAAAGDDLVEEAVATQSENVVIKPEIAGDVTRTEVSLPASTVGRLSSETNAALTFSTPIADVTIPNAGLATLSSAGGTVSVVTEQVDNTVALTLTAGGETVESIPGGLTLTVPVEDATPGTVAVLLHDDGARETIRKSIVEDGRLSIPLDGSATVEIVDNSKDFADVSDESWAADAVAFASAHELFSGTSETTFSPEQPMSRAMLATVLYNLEGRPAQSLTGGFSDVSSDAWYAEGVSWAAANGITNGYGDGQFGPDDNVTREQFVVMIWKYAGSPAANGQALNFADADQISSYAAEALRWAIANGILNGDGNGQLDPGGLATRAQAAQMLKNFMENV